MNSALYPARFAAKTAAASISDRAVVFLLAASLFTFPLQTVGIMLFGYPVSPPIVSLALLSVWLLLRPVRLLPCWRPALLLLLWSVGTAVATGNFLSLRSVAVFAVLLLPTVLEIPAAARNGAITWFLRGAILNLGLVALDLARLRLGLPQFDRLTSLILPGSIEEMDFRYAGFPRVKALFFEPSYCAMYLAFLVIFVDLMPQDRLSARKRRLLQVLFVGALLLSRGMAGFAILGAYAAVQLARHVLMWLGRPRITWTGAAIGLVVLSSVFILWLWRDEVGGARRSVVVPQRLEEVISAMANPMADRSSASERLGALSISAAYLADASLEQVLAGEGFNSSEAWVSKTYASQGGGWAVGRIANMFSTVLLGTGIIGLLLYFLYLRALTPSRISVSYLIPHASYLAPSRFVALCYFGAFILAHFATGMLIGHFLWGLLYVYLFTLHPSPLIPHPSSLIPDREVAGNG